jgi:hypothetical protein
MVAVTKNKKGDDILKIFISETTAPIGTRGKISKNSWGKTINKALHRKLKIEQHKPYKS